MTQKLALKNRLVARLPLLSAAVVAGSGLFVLAGWVAGREGFRGILPGLVAMNPMTASLFVLSAIALWLRRAERPARSFWTWETWPAAVVVVIAALRLLAIIGGPDLEIDRWLFAGSLVPHDGSPVNRMAPNTALGFLLLGLSHLTLDVRIGRSFHLGLGLAVAGFAVAFVAAVGYSFGTQHLTRVAAFIPMAINTSLTFMVLAAGIIAARPDAGLARLMQSKGPGGLLVRRLLPTSVAILLLIGWARLQGELLGWFDVRVGVALMTVVTVIAFTILLWVAASSLDRTEAERRQSDDARAFLASIVDSSTDAIAGVDRDGRIVSWNSGAEALYGWTRSEATGQSIALLWPASGQIEAATTLARLLRGERLPLVDTVRRRKDGTDVDVSMLLFPLFDASGQTIGAASISRDIGERIRSEATLAQHRRQIDALHESDRRQAARLEVANRELEAFSYSVSHDLRAPLRHIDGFADLLRKRSAERLDDAGQRYLDQISQAARHMGSLIDDLLSFSRMGRAEMQATSVDLNALVAEVRATLLVDLEGRAVEWVIHPLPLANGDGAMLRLVLANIMGNAVKYTRRRVDARIEIGTREDAGETVVFVRDNGAGFDMEYAHKLFGVFQRLHRNDEFEGTGIGLASVRRIITRHGGRTWAEGELGQGATFYFSLPTEALVNEREAA